MEKEKIDVKTQDELDEAIPPDDVYLDYDPLPYELELRASYANQALSFGSSLKEPNNNLDAGNTRIKLPDNVGATKGADVPKDD